MQKETGEYYYTNNAKGREDKEEEVALKRKK
jgi:hypothetical protein